jgi:hypothetical protein
MPRDGSSPHFGAVSPGAAEVFRGFCRRCPGEPARMGLARVGPTTPTRAGMVSDASVDPTQRAAGSSRPPRRWCWWPAIQPDCPRTCRRYSASSRCPLCSAQSSANFVDRWHRQHQALEERRMALRGLRGRQVRVCREESCQCRQIAGGEGGLRRSRSWVHFAVLRFA